ncbi:hypothetical protein GGX14DRAFT_396353 [Mycena pura]|uniref:Uncharacterized protein n=1 Tax=Mycena pura TaxID=153505 RepID=A0AAD6VEK8_9AGAR|nr:hypothetical protein GGX14DRAFT_396353 [Mycena pura]
MQTAATCKVRAGRVEGGLDVQTAVVACRGCGVTRRSVQSVRVAWRAERGVASGAAGNAECARGNAECACGNAECARGAKSGMPRAGVAYRGRRCERRRASGGRASGRHASGGRASSSVAGVRRAALRADGGCGRRCGVRASGGRASERGGEQTAGWRAEGGRRAEGGGGVQRARVGNGVHAHGAGGMQTAGWRVDGMGRAKGVQRAEMTSGAGSNAERARHAQGGDGVQRARAVCKAHAEEDGGGVQRAGVMQRAAGDVQRARGRAECGDGVQKERRVGGRWCEQRVEGAGVQRADGTGVTCRGREWRAKGGWRHKAQEACRRRHAGGEGRR